MKTFKIEVYSFDTKQTILVEGTLSELIDRYKSTLIRGSQYFDKKKVLINPKSISSLINNLNKSYCNFSNIKGLQSKKFKLKDK